MSKAQEVRAYMTKHPNATAKEVATKLKVGASYVYALRAEMARRMPKVGDTIGGLTLTKKDNDKFRWERVAVVSSNTPLPVTMEEPASDPVNHPAHYKVGGIETIDFIEAKKLNYNLGNAVKYITRADHKGNRKQDLEKALWYINRELRTA